MPFAHVMRVSFYMLAGIAGLCLGCSGGGSDSGTVEGMVTSPNGPVSGVINFYNSATGDAAMADLKDGKFVLDAQLPAGEYAIYITPPSPEPPQPGAPATPPTELTGVPSDYQSADSTPWKQQIIADSNTLDLMIGE